MDTATAPTTFDRLKRLIDQRYPVIDTAITPTASIRDDLEFDSLEVVELLIFVEEEFDIEIDDDEADGWLTVEDIVKTVDRLRK